jgi:hypothetical protein
MAISLASISKTTAKQPITVLHGNPGIGKSTFGAMAEAPIFLPTEDGQGSLNVDAFPMITDWNQVIEAITALYTEKHQYKTLVVDSLSALELLIHAQVARDNNKSSVDDIPYGKGHALAVQYWQQLLDGVTALRNDKGMVPLLIAHSEVQRFDAPDVDSYDRYTLSLHKRVSSLLYERADIIAFCTWRTVIKKEEVGFNKKVSRGVGTGERLMHLIEKPAYLAKNRYSLPETLPLDWSAFNTALSTAMSTATGTTTKQQAKPATEQ